MSTAILIAIMIAWALLNEVGDHAVRRLVFDLETGERREEAGLLRAATLKLSISDLPFSIVAAVLLPMSLPKAMIVAIVLLLARISIYFGRTSGALIARYGGSLVVGVAHFLAIWLPIAVSLRRF